MSIIGNLDFSEVSTGLLKERTIPWVDLSEGLVEYLLGSKIEVGAGEVRASTVHFDGFDAVAALDLTDISVVRLLNCQVRRFGAGVLMAHTASLTP